MSASGARAPAAAAPADNSAPTGPAYTLVLIRHGESTWNLANRFTGWTDVDLSQRGVLQAQKAGALLRAAGFTFDLAFTSVLRRAIRTLHLMQDQMGLLYIPEVKAWRLNERHYGALQGLNKQETAEQHGEEQVRVWRRSYSTQPPALELSDPRHPRFDPRYKDLPATDLPATESLQDTIKRCLPFWNSDIHPAIKRGARVVVAAHGNSLRGIVKHLDSISDQAIMGLEIPTGVPLVYELDEQMAPVRHYYLGQPLLEAPPLAVAVTGAPGAEGEATLLAEALLSSGVTVPDHLIIAVDEAPADVAAHEAAAGPAGPLSASAATVRRADMSAALQRAEYVVVPIPAAADFTAPAGAAGGGSGAALEASAGREGAAVGSRACALLGRLAHLLEPQHVVVVLPFGETPALALEGLASDVARALGEQRVAVVVGTEGATALDLLQRTRQARQGVREPTAAQGKATASVRSVGRASPAQAELVSHVTSVVLGLVVRLA